MLHSIFEILSVATSLYMGILSIFIILSWFHQTGSVSPLYLFFYRLANPYLQLFRSIPGLRFYLIDFSPLLGFLILALASQIFTSLAVVGSISVGLILAVVIQFVWGFVRFMLTGVFLIALARLLSLTLFTQWGVRSFWNGLDWVSKKFYRNFVIHFRRSSIPRFTRLLITNMIYSALYFLLFFYLIQFAIQSI